MKPSTLALLLTPFPLSLALSIKDPYCRLNMTLHEDAAPQDPMKYTAMLTAQFFDAGGEIKDLKSVVHPPPPWPLRRV